MQLSVIILNYNVKHFLELCIKSVQAAIQNLNAEIIVVDNASTDGSKEMMQTFFSEITYLYQTENVGFPKGNNIGVKCAKGKYICILNPDTVVAEDTFSRLLKFAETKEKLGVIGCKLVDGTGSFLPESKRNVPTPKVSLLKMIGKSKAYYAERLQENQIGQASVFVGAFMFVEKQKYLELKGFDEDFFMYGEDIDLSYRFEKNGYENYYFGKTTIIHYKGESTNKDKVYLQRFYGAMKIFYKKHFKTNFLFDFAIDLGIKLFSFLGNFKNQPTEKTIPEHYILVSANRELYQKIQQKSTIPVDWIRSLEDVAVLDQPQKQIEILVDHEIVSFKEYIAFISKHQKSNKTFKIKAKQSHFFVGSNDKNNKGAVLSF